MTVHDFLAIGVGPFNLGLACLTEPIDELDGVFLDQRPGFDWHPGMMLQDATLQTPFLGDLVTLADPTNPFSFLNYVKQQGRIYAFYIRENFFLLRQEFNRYCQWAAEQLGSIRWNTRVDWIERCASDDCYVVRATDLPSGRMVEYRARRLVLGVGTVPAVPECCRGLDGPVVHSSEYLDQRERLMSLPSVTVLGSGQSAAEIFHDLLQSIDTHGYALSWMTRSPRFFPLEYAKLTLEMTSPDYVDYFFELPPAKRDRLLSSQKHLYKGINEDLINTIYELLYTKHLACDCSTDLRTNRELIDARWDAQRQRFALTLRQVEQGQTELRETAGLVLATGYANRTPSFLEGIADRIRWDTRGRFDVARNYSIDHEGREIFVQNAELHTHGFVTPDLGMASYRNAWIIREMTGRAVYPIERRIAFQRFETSADRAAPKAAPELV